MNVRRRHLSARLGTGGRLLHAGCAIALSFDEFLCEFYADDPIAFVANSKEEAMRIRRRRRRRRRSAIFLLLLRRLVHTAS